ncbi:GNAT family N-acetyltransferase [Ascidiimonas aurantiaca]|uniref:GNAT family N-acetyltransferase n=1 Tax=Ascidiimonas aurantiaca TaxID=1685432 RepID=UPI0030EF6EE9
MLKLHGSHIFLRAMEPADIDFLYLMENDVTIWEVSDTKTPYSRFILKKYLDNCDKDIYEMKQLRLAISDNENELKGLIDLFEFDPANYRAGVGIVLRKEERKKGIAEEALNILSEYAFNTLGLRQLYAHITADNEASKRLFTKCGFEQTGVKKQWAYHKGIFKDVLFYQKLNTDHVS